ncbi:ABC transporter permease [Extibacter muris]|uniref:ABC transporter permease n=1 Tax=Extibacter muris TaxID=1796622 RepID=UPI001D0988A9|nr:ABC transporter permease [Extibacter muris]MCB6201226.1 ABC transporter permease [Extibacter muris]MCQ4664731.1 ABC transporter permease [Extibacter muris]MCQ4694567.1 ABC transporter permease [Extibacter muris]
MKVAKLQKYIRLYAMFIVLLILVAVFSIMTPAFLKSSNISSVLRQISMLGITAVGMMLPILLGGIDLSVGAIITFVNIICAYMMVNKGWNAVAAVAATLAISVLIGMIDGIIIAKVNIPPLIMTFAMQMILEGSSYVLSNGLPIYGFPEKFAVIGQGYIAFAPIPVIIMILCFLFGAFVLNKTYFGRFFYAVGGNEEASKLSGINVFSVKTLAYTLSGLFAGIAGIVMLSRTNSGTPNAGKGFEMDVLTAIVLGGVSINGGRGRIHNVIAGVLIIGVLQNGLILMNVGTYVQYIVKGVVLAAAVGYDCLQNLKKTN